MEPDSLDVVELEDEVIEDSESVVHLMMSLEGREDGGTGTRPLEAPGHHRTEVKLEVAEWLVVVGLG